MLRHRKRPGLSLLGVLALCLFILSACGGSTPSQGNTNNPLASSSPTQAPSSDDIDQQTVTENPEDALNYWTSDKMLSALNVDLLNADNIKDLQQQADNAIKNVTGSVTQGENPVGNLPEIPPMAPQDLQDLLQQLSQLSGQQSSTGTQTSASLLGAFSNTQPTARYSYPLSTIGKVFFTAGGKNWVCSGTAINSSNKSVVDTAGHCVYDRHSKSYVNNWIFCPMYYKGSAPYGCWAAHHRYTTKSWVSHGDFESDYGAVVVHPRSSGRLVNRIGGAGWAYNYSPKQSFHAYGYPAAKPFNGQTMKSCSGTSTAWKYNNGTMDMSIPCNMTGGSSGGGWFTRINGGWYLNGHNDFTWSKHPGQMFSPYYGATWYNLYKRASTADVGPVVNR
ncbi:MAG: hypothetical protein J2P36_31910 [Ktedonobacteraceae bacterium]|nr:hypothetical protein [Ktedonobacteraceae bacterium]